jgi:FMN phosphatase YigB (HAD superfamily)
MQTILEPNSALHIKEKITVTELTSILDHYHDQIKVLSLDCFDTLLWRKTATPKDVFYDLENQPTFHQLGYTAIMRSRSEIKARDIQIVEQRHNEVKLHDIYLHAFPHLTVEQLNLLTEEEIKTEIAACYALPQTIELMRIAHRKGLKIIIVSDTYFTEHQLRRLLASKLPAEVMTAIDLIFCSSEYKKSKVKGIFTDVLLKLNVPAETILHIGDNEAADLTAAKNMKLRALHLIHHENNLVEMKRLQATAACLLDSTLRDKRPLNDAFRGILASHIFNINKPEELIGYASIGPVMYAFGQYILNEIETLKQTGKQVKVLFLMRDAYLPSLVCDALAEKKIGSQVNISRFTAIASSFRTKKNVVKYLIDVVNSKRFKEICLQLLLPDIITTPLLEVVANTENAAYEFTQLICQEQILAIIFKKSEQFRQRLKLHLQKRCGLKSGDTVMLVDLGYSGSVQSLLEPIFRDEMNIHMIGRYLISLAIPGWETSRSGLLNPSWCDNRTLLTLVTYIALFEQICTSNEKSTIDYDEEGNPIFTKTKLTDEQYAKIKLIQTECVRFAKDAVPFLKACQLDLTTSIYRDTVLAELGRLLFLPSQTEITFFQSLQFDVNLGTDDILKIFDHDAGLLSLRKRGLFFPFMEKTGKSMRMNYPAELRTAGIELSMTLMAQHRFDLSLRIKDISLRRETVPIIMIQNSNIAHSTLEAELTYDGYFSILIPIGQGQIKTGLLFGKKYRFVQIESVELILMNALLKEVESQFTEDYTSQLVFDQMTYKTGKLYECTSPNSLMLIEPALKADNKNLYVLRVVFRPIE